jgi:hypothetical protein
MPAEKTAVLQCVMMRKIAAQLISEGDDGSPPETVVCVFHLSEGSKSGSTLSRRTA